MPRLLHISIICFPAYCLLSYARFIMRALTNVLSKRVNFMPWLTKLHPFLLFNFYFKDAASRLVYFSTYNERASFETCDTVIGEVKLTNIFIIPIYAYILMMGTVLLLCVVPLTSIQLLNLKALSIFPKVINRWCKPVFNGIYITIVLCLSLLTFLLTAIPVILIYAIYKAVTYIYGKFVAWLLRVA